MLLTKLQKPSEQGETMTKDEALKLALEALKQIDEAMPFPVAKLAQASIKEALAQPEQEPVAIHQFRSPHCADWYDGIPDHHDGHGPYEVRTLYTHPVKDLEDIDINITWNENSMRDFGKDELNFARAIEKRIKNGN